MLANVIIEKEVGRMRRETAFRFAVHFIYTFFSPYLQTTTTPETNFFVPSIIAADVGMGAGVVAIAFGHFLNNPLDILLVSRVCSVGIQAHTVFHLKTVFCYNQYFGML